ncbi:MAG: Uma2 family endonuclease [Chloroflexi bacterium]|nr:Uma2 family endonuclease [Chloroflexota bacterium]
MVTREAPAATASEQSQRLKMTYEEFLEWAGESRQAEWVNGEVIVFMPPKTPHARLISFLSTLLNLFVKFFNLGEVLPAPYEMKVSPTGSGREPDIIFIAAAHRDRVTPEKLLGPADLVVEIVSDDSVSRDRVDKFGEYEEISVPEYWIIDNRPGRRQRAEFYQLDEGGQFQPVPVGKDGIYRSKVIPGFWLNVNWLWAEEFPDPQLTFAEIAGPATVIAKLQELNAKARPAE